MKDRFDREHVYLRLSITDRCNLRCTYCRPVTGLVCAQRPVLSVEEIERLTTVFGRLGIRKVRITGGEPTVRKDVIELCGRLSRVPGIETLALTTNGLRLVTLAESLFDAGVRRLNVSLDSIRRERFARITGRDVLPRVMAGLSAALDAGFFALKLNCVVIAGVNDDELLDFVELARHRPIEIRFIEFMPFRGNGWQEGRFISCRAMLDVIEREYTLVPDGNPERTGGVARDFRIPGFLGRVSFISPFTDSFCRRCNRVRVTAEGRMKTCLYSAGEGDLGTALRRGATDDQLEELIVAALQRKPERHLSLRETAGSTRVRMSVVGG